VAKKGAIRPILREICPRKKCTPNIGAITGILLRVKISEGCFVSDAPPAISRPCLIIETNSWKIRGYRENVVVPKSAKVGRSVDYQLTITSRLFTRLTMFSFECISSEPV
jgi:hypothetical protein